MIDIETLVVGDLLTAKDECIMDETSYYHECEPALIIGKQYPILFITSTTKTICISSEVDVEHYFGKDEINKFFEQ